MTWKRHTIRDRAAWAAAIVALSAIEHVGGVSRRLKRALRRVR